MLSSSIRVLSLFWRLVNSRLMIYQILITACWRPHLLSWCMVMIVPAWLLELQQTHSFIFFVFFPPAPSPFDCVFFAKLFSLGFALAVVFAHSPEKKKPKTKTNTKSFASLRRWNAVLRRTWNAAEENRKSRPSLSAGWLLTSAFKPAAGNYWQRIPFVSNIRPRQAVSQRKGSETKNSCRLTCSRRWLNGAQTIECYNKKKHNKRKLSVRKRFRAERNKWLHFRLAIMNLLYIIVTMSVCEVSLRRKCSVGDTQGGLKFRLLNSGICVSPGSSRLPPSFS